MSRVWPFRPPIAVSGSAPSPTVICRRPVTTIAARKQYRYHERWQALRDEQKFDQLVPFGHALPALRRRVLADAQRLEEPERATLAALVLLLDAAHLRVGNRQYLAENGTYGATTLLKRHVRFGEGLELQFMAKGGKKVRAICVRPGFSAFWKALQTCQAANSSSGRT